MIIDNNTFCWICNKCVVSGEKTMIEDNQMYNKEHNTELRNQRCAAGADDTGADV